MATVQLSVRPSSFTPVQMRNEEVYRSSNNRRRIRSLGGDKWSFNVSWINLTGDERRDLWAELVRGSAAGNDIQLQLSNAMGYSARGLATSAVTTGTNNAGATELNLDANPVSTVGAYSAGDFINVQSWGLHMVLEDADTDGAGLTTVSIWPALRRDAPAGNDVFNVQPSGYFNVADNVSLPVQMGNANDAWCSSVTIQLEEVTV